MTMEQVVEFVSKLGLPISLVIAVLYGGYRLANWCGIRIDTWVNPLLLKHFNLIDSLNESTKANTELTKQLVNNQEKTNVTLDKHTEILTGLVVHLKEHRGRTEDGTSRHKTD